jgi:23S rRNA pseudouridine1911/1915/1917 synthase
MVIYEDNHLLVLNKPAGWLVQADKTGDETIVDWGKAYLKEKYHKPGAVYLHPAHRIDRPVSGAVLLARTDKALGRLTVLFRDKGVHKTYLALCTEAPKIPNGELRHFLLKDAAHNVVKAFDKPVEGAKESITRYELLGKHGHYWALKVSPITGRAHQIRVQLATMGCTILGDLKYGAPNALPDASIGLHCYSMELLHPVQQVSLRVVAPLPEVNWWTGLIL